MRISLSLTSSPSSPRIPMTISPSATTPSSLHTLASEAACIPVEKIKMIFRGRLIPKDGQGNVVKEFLLEDGCVVHCMGKPSQPSSITDASASSPSNDSTLASASASASAVAPSVVRPPPNNNTNAANSNANTAGNGGHPLKSALETMKSNNEATSYSTGVATLIKLLNNIISHPTEEKYRTVKRANPAFQKRLGRLSYSTSAMAAIGFTVRREQNDTSTATTTGEYILVPSAEAWPKLLECQNILNVAGADAQRRSAVIGGGGGGTTAVGDANLATSGMNAPMPSGMEQFGMPNLNAPGGMGGMGGPGGMADALLQNPSQLRSLLQNPMVRRMMENNPNIANNPMAQQSLEMMQQNPQMLETAIRMMSENPELRRSLIDNASGSAGAVDGLAGTGGQNFDPDAMRRQMAMMQALSGGMGAGGAEAANVPSSQTNTQGASQMGTGGIQNSVQNGGSATGDAELTEEEMIAEAIARSLRES